MTPKEYQQVRQKVDHYGSLINSQERIQETLEKMKKVNEIAIRFNFPNSDIYSWAYIPDENLFLETLRNYLEFTLTMIQNEMAKFSMFGDEKPQNS